MEYKKIIFKEGKISRITLNYPEKRNVEDKQMMTEIMDALDRANKNPDCRVILVDANGPDFSAGHDMVLLTEEWAGKGWTEDPGADELRTTYDAIFVDYYQKLWMYPKAIVAAVHGHVIAGAVMFIQKADIIIASEDAVFSDETLRMGCCVNLPEFIFWAGYHRVAEYLFTGNRMSAQDAYRLNIVNRVVPREKLLDEAMKWCERIALMPPVTIEMNKRAMRLVYDRLGLRENLYLASYFNALSHSHRADHDTTQKFINLGLRKVLKEYREKFPLWEEEKDLYALDKK
jgi:enoyl-CoA hydratase